MPEIIQEAFRGINLPITIALGVILLYWIIAMLGMIDLDAIDGFLGLDTDVHVDVDGHGHGQGGDSVDGHGDVEGHGEGATPESHSPNAFQAVAKFMGAQDAPIMFVLSTFTLILWAGNLIGNYYFNKGDSTFLANCILGASLVGAFLLTKLTVRPLRPLMKMMRTASNNEPVIGMAGTVRSKELTIESGQVEVIQDGASILLNARLSEGASRQVDRGAQVLIVARDDDGKRYVARPLTPISQKETNNN